MEEWMEYIRKTNVDLELELTVVEKRSEELIEKVGKILVGKSTDEDAKDSCTSDDGESMKIESNDEASKGQNGIQEGLDKERLIAKVLRGSKHFDYDIESHFIECRQKVNNVIERANDVMKRFFIKSDGMEASFTTR